MTSISELSHQLSQQEAEYNRLQKELQDLQNGTCSPELEKLKEENSKLKYRILHLERSIEMEESKCQDNLSSMIAILSSIFGSAIKSAFPDLTEQSVILTPSTKESFGDYQCNNAMSISKIIKTSGVSLSPRDVAEKIRNNLPSSNLIDKVEIAGPGFINIFISKQFVSGELKKILTHGVRPPKVQSKRIVVDYSAPNIAKEMHVGHLRSTIIGDSIARFCEFLGHSVLRLNHIGDWGTQFGMLIAHLKDKQKESDKNLAISDLQAFYKESKKRFDTDEDFKKRAYKAVVKLQAHDAEHIGLWNFICDISRQAFNDVYHRLGIVNLQERGESFYQDHMVEMVRELESNGVLNDEEGRKLLWPPNCEIPLTIVKSDGGYTYDTSDLATIRQRLYDEKAEWIIYVVDGGQSVHFKGIFAAAKMLGWWDPNKVRIDHVGFGVVLGSDRTKFKSRSGDTVRLVDLLNEGMQRSMETLKQKGRDKELSPEELAAAQSAVAYSCIKYADLCHNRTSDYVFSFDKMLEDKGNTAVYLLYAYTRISAIARNAKISTKALELAAQSEPLLLDHPKEWKLGKAIMKFSDVLLKLEQDLLLHSLCDYLYDLATTFTEFYDVCYCIEQKGGETKINMWRILLCEATARVMATGFHILGLTPVQRM